MKKLILAGLIGWALAIIFSPAQLVGLVRGR